MRLFLAMVFLAVFVAPASAGGVRIVQAPGLGSFQEIQAAVDAAADGDVLLVGVGTYGPVTIAGKGLSLLTVQPGFATIQGTLTIKNLAAGQHVLVSGLHAYGAKVFPLSAPGLVVDACQGHVRVQDSVFTGGYGADGYYPGGSGGHGAVITNSPTVALVRCTLKGGNGYVPPNICYDCEGGAGGYGANSNLATVALYDCVLQGGDGGRAGYRGGAGGHGYQYWVLFASGSQFRGGKGGDGDDNVIAFGGDGGHGLNWGFTPAQLLDNTYAGGAGGIAYVNPPGNGKPGLPINGTVNQLPGKRRALTGASLVSDSSTRTFRLNGEPGDKLFLIGSKSPAFAFVASYSGTWLVPLPNFMTSRPHGVVPGNGVLVVQFPTPDINTPSELNYWQGLVVDAQGKPFLSSPLHEVTLDGATAPDCNGNGQTDWVEILQGTTPDCDHNIVPDACDPDCNNNGVADGCDILQGTSGDCNGNYLPDECDIAAGTSFDCNQNGKPDECDIAGGTSQDLNGNGIPDECELGVTWYVDAAAPPGGNGSQAQPFQAIGDAIPLSVSGDTVLVANGTYKGPKNRDISFGGRDIVVKSQGGATQCIIDCEDLGRAFYLHDGETMAARIEGFTITRGRAPTAQSMGGGILVTQASATIKSCNFSACFAEYYGGGICSYFNGTVQILECIVSGCNTGTSPGNEGGGIYLFTSSTGGNPYDATSVVRATLVSNCSSDNGAGIAVRSSRNVVVSHCTITLNQARNRGGGLYSQTYTTHPDITGLRLDNTRLLNNTAQEGGGAFLHDSWTTAHVTNVTIANNSATTGGGGLHIWSSGGGGQGIVNLVNTILWNNSAPVGPQAQISGLNMAWNPSYSDIQGGQAQVAVGPNVTLNWGAGNIDLDPQFANAQLKLGPTSPCIDAGNATAVALDWGDIDGDGNKTEPVPLDLALLPRVKDIPAIPDTGTGPPPIVDMGCFERQP